MQRALELHAGTARAARHRRQIFWATPSMRRHVEAGYRGRGRLHPFRLLPAGTRQNTGQTVARSSTGLILRPTFFSPIPAPVSPRSSAHDRLPPAAIPVRAAAQRRPHMLALETRRGPADRAPVLGDTIAQFVAIVPRAFGLVFQFSNGPIIPPLGDASSCLPGLRGNTCYAEDAPGFRKPVGTIRVLAEFLGFAAAFTVPAAHDGTEDYHRAEDISCRVGNLGGRPLNGNPSVAVYTAVSSPKLIKQVRQSPRGHSLDKRHVFQIPVLPVATVDRSRLAQSLIITPMMAAIIPTAPMTMSVAQPMPVQRVQAVLPRK